MERHFINNRTGDREIRGRAVLRPFDGPAAAVVRGRSLSAAWET